MLQNDKEQRRREDLVPDSEPVKDARTAELERQLAESLRADEIRSNSEGVPVLYRPDERDYASASSSWLQLYSTLRVHIGR